MLSVKDITTLTSITLPDANELAWRLMRAEVLVDVTDAALFVPDVLQ
jgi:hypothetical protein